MAEKKVRRASSRGQDIDTIHFFDRMLLRRAGDATISFSRLEQ
jgi:hypothetical protein